MLFREEVPRVENRSGARAVRPTTGRTPARRRRRPPRRSARRCAPARRAARGQWVALEQGASGRAEVLQFLAHPAGRKPVAAVAVPRGTRAITVELPVPK